MTTEAECEMMQLQTKIPQELMEARKRQGRFYLNSQREQDLFNTLNLDSSLKNYMRTIFVVLSQPVCDYT